MARRGRVPAGRCLELTQLIGAHVRQRAMIANLHLRSDRTAALELLLRLLATAVAVVAILGLLPAIAAAAG